MQTLRGKGRIYDSSEKFIDEVTYEIHLKSATESAGPVWRGEITPDKGIMLVGNYIIELQNGCKGHCITKMNTYSSFGLVIDSYNLEGTGPLTQ